MSPAGFGPTIALAGGHALLVLLATLAAGAFGAVARSLTIARAPRRGVDVVNIVGTLLLAVTVALHGREMIDDGVVVIVGLGFCGAFTTFSGWMAALVVAGERRPILGPLRRASGPLGLGVGVTVVTFVLLGG
jgi:fluoride exporter